VKDLLSIGTLGFRGEALPSIASVSRLLLESRAEDEQTGAAVEIAGGKMLRCEEVARGRGTTITVRDLFYNVPARKKFLRSEQTELAHIAALVTHYSLAHPAKSFRLSAGANELLAVTPVPTLKERVYQVFGSQSLDDLTDLGDRERDLQIPAGDAPGDEHPDRGAHARRCDRTTRRRCRDTLALWCLRLRPRGCPPPPVAASRHAAPHRGSDSRRRGCRRHPASTPA